MTVAELNRDIKRLNKSIKNFKTEAGKLEPYFKFIEKVAKPEFIRLFYAADDFKAINKDSVLILLRLNLSHRFVPFHQFGLKIEI